MQLAGNKLLPFVVLLSTDKKCVGRAADPAAVPTMEGMSTAVWGGLMYFYSYLLKRSNEG